MDARRNGGTAAPEGDAANPRRANPGAFGQIVLVFQGGGALGAYQAGVYEALHEAGVEPDWIIGTSIGAINAGLIAGAPRGERIARLREFWRRVEQPAGAAAFAWPWFGRSLPNLATLLGGVPGFFSPNPLAFASPFFPLAPEAAGYYSTRPLERTLRELIDVSLFSRNAPRLTVGAANVRASEMRYFDSRTEALTVSHILASGALPPAFPATRIDGELYWDGGVLSNTPVEAAFDDNPRRNSLIFAVHMWRPDGDEPDSVWRILHRQKELQYASRAKSQIRRQQQIHRLRHVIAELAMRLPKEARDLPEIRELASYGCLTRIHVARLLAPRLDDEDHTKDIDFGREGIGLRWAAGFRDAQKMLAEAPWEAEVDPLEGVYLHETRGAPMAGA